MLIEQLNSRFSSTTSHRARKKRAVHLPLSDYCGKGKAVLPLPGTFVALILLLITLLHAKEIHTRRQSFCSFFPQNNEQQSGKSWHGVACPFDGSKMRIIQWLVYSQVLQFRSAFHPSLGRRRLYLGSAYCGASKATVSRTISKPHYTSVFHEKQLQWVQMTCKATNLPHCH